jgi:hypothetical protein
LREKNITEQTRTKKLFTRTLCAAIFSVKINQERTKEIKHEGQGTVREGRDFQASLELPAVRRTQRGADDCQGTCKGFGYRRQRAVHLRDSQATSSRLEESGKGYGEKMKTQDTDIHVFQKHGQLFTTSIDVAEKFGKDHSFVLRAIRNMDCSEEFNRCNFALVNYLDEKGERRHMPITAGFACNSEQARAIESALEKIAQY